MFYDFYQDNDDHPSSLFKEVNLLGIWKIKEEKYSPTGLDVTA